MTATDTTKPGILALDLGTRLGWCRVPDPGTPAHREHAALDLAELHPDRWKRMDLFARWLTRELQDHPIGMLAVEEPFTAATDNVGTKHVLHGQFVFAQVIGLRLGVQVREISRFDVFRSVVGWCSKPAPERKTKSGRPGRRAPSKREIRKAINARHGTDIADDNEADAVAIADLVLAEMAGTGHPRNPEPALLLDASNEAAKLDTAPEPPALAQLRAEQAAVPLESIKAPARRQLERALASIGVGTIALPPGKRERPVRGRRKAKP